MKALRWHAAGDVRLEDVDVPRRGAGQSLVEVKLCGICGSDLSEFRDGPRVIRRDMHPLTGQAPPVTLGHEFAGVVVESGEDGLPPGTRVTADACWRCGRCDACRTGDYHRCRYGGSIGLHSDGAFARHVVVPDYCLVPIDDGVPDEVAAQTEPFAVAMHALDRGHFRAAEDVLVLGFGPIGAAAALTARALGARVVVVEKDDRRFAAASDLGFECLEAGDDLARRARARIGGGGAHVVLDSTGVAAVLPQAVDAARRGGRIVLIGLGGPPAALQGDRLVLWERTITGSLGYRHDLPRVMRLFSEGVIDPTPLVSEIVPLAGAADVMHRLSSDPGGSIKTIVRTHG